ncbi:MAG TPA: response regulator transcription factor [Elusimicrobiota bacterium]|jgi:DNA-binding response OmpR family regulator|nr:response regulator transcription factor [Elusimicrobiota bacterium]
MRINLVCASRDPNRAGVLLEALGRNGFSLTVVQRAKEVQNLLAQRGCDLLVVGQHLIDEEGLNLVKALRSRGQTRHLAIVALLEHAATAPAPQSDPARRLAGGFISASGQMRLQAPAAPPAPAVSGKASVRLSFFQAGADECLSLDQDVAECLARIKAVLHRTMSKPQEEILKMGPIDLNLTSYTLRVSGKDVPLTSKELDLLYVFLSSPNRVLSRPYLIERVWGYNYFGSPRTVDVHVRRLREKLGKAARYITTVPCVGYKLVPPGAEG